MNEKVNKAFRAGRYVRQPTGYRAFIPAPLPPDPPVMLDGSLRERLSEADYALGRLDVTPAAANRLVGRLEEIGLLREITGYARNRRFRFEPYMRLFEE